MRITEQECKDAWVVYCELYQAKLLREDPTIKTRRKGINLKVTARKCSRNKGFGRRLTWSGCERITKKAINILRNLPLPIAGNQDDYWFTKIVSEIQDTIDTMFTPHIRARAKTVRSLKTSARNIRQGRLDV
jgi:hypothetical protein